ncbi:MAG TPA: hypothetical protein DIS79_04700 [Bacteroidetes bacterium]|nr:hypothetical protein [Bacteroidota bacterium]HRK04510.1 glycosyltransferase family 4 protein [Chlorobiota bacterium]
MRILVINWQDRTHPQAGGAEEHLHEIFGRIAAAGHDVHLLCCSHQGAAEQESLDGLVVHRGGSRNVFNYYVPWWWKRFGHRLNPDLVVDDINKIPFFSPLFIRKPILGIIHHFFGDDIFKETNVVAGSYVRFCENLVGRIYRQTPISVVSESTRIECISRGLPEKNLSVIYNGIDHRRYPMSISTKAATPTIVSFGRLKRYKSVDHIIRALPTIAQTIPDVRLEILGDGDDRRFLENLASELQLTDRITFHGFVSKTDKIRWLSRAHIAVNASVKEGWGITNLEANACGTAVVSADSPGLRDSVRDGVSGLLYPYGDVNMLSRLVSRVLIDRSERDRLSEGALRWASTFTWERSAREMLDLCERVVSHHTP